VVVLAAATAAAAATVFRNGLLDPAALALAAVGWAFATLPASIPLSGTWSPAVDVVLVVGLAAPVAAFSASRRPAPDRLAVLALIAGAVALVALQALRGSAAGRGVSLVAAVAAAAVLPVVWFGLVPPRTAGWHHTLATMSAAVAGAAVQAALAAQAAVAAGLTAAALLLHGAFLLVYRVPWPVRFSGDVAIDRQPARVFRELTDLRTPLAPASPERRLEPLDDGPIGVGSQLRYRSSGGETETAAVTAFEAPAVFGYEIHKAGYRTSAWYGIEPTEGGSRVRWRHGLDVPLHWWTRRSYRRRIQEITAQSTERLRAGRRFVDDGVTDPSASAG
jgi:hypothetical protein